MAAVVIGYLHQTTSTASITVCCVLIFEMASTFYWAMGMFESEAEEIKTLQPFAMQGNITVTKYLHTTVNKIPKR